MQELGITYFFDIIKWVFSDFLLRVTVLSIPVIYYLIAILVLGIVFAGVLNTARGAFNNVKSHVRKGK